MDGGGKNVFKCLSCEIKETIGAILETILRNPTKNQKKWGMLGMVTSYVESLFQGDYYGDTYSHNFPFRHASKKSERNYFSFFFSREVLKNMCIWSLNFQNIPF